VEKTTADIRSSDGSYLLATHQNELGRPQERLRLLARAVELLDGAGFRGHDASSCMGKSLLSIIILKKGSLLTRRASRPCRGASGEG
jgi:hypothetical protein